MKLYILNINNLPDPKDIEKNCFSLPDGRLERSLSYKKEDDRKRSLGAGLLIKKVAGNKAILFSAHKKPYTHGIFFNISHSGEFVICCTAKSEVGCDIEKIKDFPKAILSRFSEDEREYIGNDSSSFFEIWTKREAYMKMTGEGISLPLDDFEVTENAVIRKGEKQSCFLHSMSYGEYVISICCENSEEIEIIEI